MASQRTTKIAMGWQFLKPAMSSDINSQRQEGRAYSCSSRKRSNGQALHLAGLLLNDGLYPTHWREYFWEMVGWAVPDEFPPRRRTSKALTASGCNVALHR